MHVESKLRKPLITGGKTLSDVSEDISKRVEEKPSISYIKKERLLQMLRGTKSLLHLALQVDI